MLFINKHAKPARVIYSNNSTIRRMMIWQNHNTKAIVTFTYLYMCFINFPLLMTCHFQACNLKIIIQNKLVKIWIIKCFRKGNFISTRQYPSLATRSSGKFLGWIAVKELLLPCPLLSHQLQPLLNQDQVVQASPTHQASY